MSNTLPANQPDPSNSVPSASESPAKRRRTVPATWEEQLTDAALHLLDDHWILGNSVHITSEVVPAVLRRHASGDKPVDIFQQIIDPVMDLLLEIINYNIDQKSNGARRTNTADFFHWYATEMRRENTYANHLHNSRRHLQFINEKYGAIKKMGVQRFEEMLHAFRPKLEQLTLLAQQLSCSFQAQLTAVSLLLIDELVSAYQPSASVKTAAEATGEPIPAVFFPRKPHPNGLEVLLVATFLPGHPKRTKRLPYLTHAIPHLRTGDSAPQDVLHKVIETWPLVPHPHYVGDTAFGSTQILEIVRQRGGVGTFSISSNSCPQLWQALAFNLPIDHFRVAAQQQSGVVASVHLLLATTDATKRTLQQLLSTAFTMTPVQALVPRAVAVAPQAPASGTSTATPVIPVYTEEELNHKRVDELRAICRQFNIHQGKRKASS
eukprot:TRINITY_DN2990_c0_g1_i1.p1 TRINITY_DN2990_c0_g1~~TRINITY_DN2990_c0_g1_i1.p1  ORF type:complete len:436 (-),score=87.15 TRINITY_DN2990_c0_g1_i1:428-1735(-)